MIGRLIMVGLGAGLMYVLDPDRGKRRRALLVDQAAHAFRTAEDAAGKTARDSRNRFQGLLHSIGALTRGSDVVPDDILEARIRSKVGGLVRHPKALEISARRGRVTLSGPILADEADDVVGCILGLRGVRHIDNKLDIHHRGESVPALQGEGRRRPDTVLPVITPTSRFLAGSAGVILALYGFRNFWSKTGAGLALLGVSLLASGLVGRDLTR